MPFISSRAIVRRDGADGLRAAASTWLNALTEPLAMILVTGDSEVSEVQMEAFPSKCPEVEDIKWLEEAFPPCTR